MFSHKKKRWTKYYATERLPYTELSKRSHQCHLLVIMNTFYSNNHTSHCAVYYARLVRKHWKVAQNKISVYSTNQIREYRTAVSKTLSFSTLSKRPKSSLFYMTQILAISGYQNACRHSKLLESTQSLPESYSVILGSNGEQFTFYWHLALRQLYVSRACTITLLLMYKQ